MNYDIILTRIPSERVLGVLSHHFASDRGVALTEAREFLGKLPVTYEENVSKLKLGESTARLRQMGVGFQVVPANQETHSEPAPLPRNDTSLHSQPSPPLPQQVIPRPQPRPRQPLVAFNPPAPKKRTPVIPVLITFAVLGIGIYVILSFRQDYTLQRTGETSYTPLPAATSAAHTTRRVSKKPHKGKKAPSAAQTRQTEQAKSYLDSALDAQGSMAIRFFQMAISLNKKNVAAWHGLATAYAEEGMQKEEEATRQAMRNLFGPDVFSLAAEVAAYGKLRSMILTEEGILRVEYLSGQLDRESLAGECFQLSAVLGRNCGCTDLSLFAMTGKTSGLLAALPASPVPTSREEFNAAATCTYLE